jgi:dienelactone hydrolase
MLSEWYARKMFAWETALTTRDTNRIVRPLEWGAEWLQDFLTPGEAAGGVDSLAAMAAVSARIASESDRFFGYRTPADFRLEERYPQLYPTNVRPETLAQDAEWKRKAEAGELKTVPFLRFTSPVATPYPENDLVNARWFPASKEQEEKFRRLGKPRQAIVVMPQWNADAFSHNALCEIFNRFGISCLRLSKPYHDTRRPAELERSDYAVSSNIGRTISACRQAVADIRSCVDWLETQGYEQFGVLGTSLGSCYAFIAAAHDPRIQVCAFNHASTWFGDVVWTGQSTRHIRQAFEDAGLTQAEVRQLFLAVSPMAFMERFAAARGRRTLVVHAKYDLTFIEEFSLDVLKNFNHHQVDYVSKVLPCGHYTTGETPYKYMDAWYLSKFIHGAFKELAFRFIEGRAAMVDREVVPQ